MSDYHYPWIRYWFPRDTRLHLDQEGFLVDPDAPWAEPTNAHVTDLTELASVKCLVLLGEPGSGETTALREYASQLEASENVISVDLRDYPSDVYLRDELFRDSRLTAWAEGTHILWLFLDGLDEGIENLPAITRVLSGQIKHLPVERLRLRITCRTADWPAMFEGDLNAIWPGHDELGVYEIAPLRRTDTEQAAKIRKLDPEAFLREVLAQKAHAFAQRPITLDLLMRMFEQEDKLPDSIDQLYAQGCRNLCEEMNSYRHELRLQGNLTPTQRLALAERIAALTVLGNKAAIWTAPDSGLRPDSDLRVDDLLDIDESTNSYSLENSQHAIREVLATGLFASRGSNRLGWAHQTIGEYLAARFMVKKSLSLLQAKSLLYNPIDGQVVPQLRGIATWAVSMRDDLLTTIIESDPDVALQGDLIPARNEVKARLVEALLSHLTAGEIVDNWDSRFSYRKLCHPDLENQLRPIITDPETHPLARRAAIDIAEACGQAGLQRELLDLALNTDERYADRVNATYALWTITEPSALDPLRPLVTESRDTDPDFELRGIALQALWPELISTADVFNAIEPPQGHLVGEYTRFLHHLPARLQPHDMPTALKWVERQQRSYDLPYELEQLVYAILGASRDNLHHEGILPALAQALWSRLIKHDHDFTRIDSADESVFLADKDQRLNLVREILPHFGNPTDAGRLLVIRPSLIGRDDTLWLIQEIHKSAIKDEQMALANIIWHLADRTSASQMDAVLGACERIPILAAQFGHPGISVLLDSPEASQQREQYERNRGVFNERPPRPRPVHQAAELVEQQLAIIEDGHYLQWSHLARLLQLGDDDISYQDSLDSDVRSFPGWQRVDNNTQERIVTTAVLFLQSQSADPEILRAKSEWNLATLAGYKALRLLLNETPDVLANLPAEVWNAWVPGILGYPAQGGVTEIDDKHRLCCLGYLHAPEATIIALREMILDRNSSDSFFPRLEWVRQCWDSRMADSLLMLAHQEDLKRVALTPLLRELMLGHASKAQQLAEKIVIASHSHENDEQRERGIASAEMLLLHATDAGWPTIWPILAKDSDFGKAVFESLVAGIDVRGDLHLGSRLSEVQLADLYQWLELHYPRDEDPGYDSGPTLTLITPRHEIAEFRESVLRQLRNKGTYEASEQIDRLSKQFPNKVDLKLVHIDAKHLARQATWIPPTPDEILALARDRSKRLVQSGEHLLDVVAEVFAKLQVDLHGENPRVRGLWNEFEEKYRPKDEEDLSDFLKNYLDDHLTDRAIVFGREVRIRRPSPGAKGENTDIHIDATSKPNHGQGYERITAIAEVKGGWHPDLFTAMKDQLVDRYLKDNACDHGLYIVFWVSCPEWDKSDGRRRHISKSIDDVRKELDEQALALSADGKVVRAFVLDASYR